MSTGQQKENKKKFTLTHAILIIGFLILIAIVCVIGYQLLKPQPEIDDTGALVVDESNLAQILEEINSTEADGMFEVNMNTIWHFPDGESASDDAYLANGGANRLPISFEIMLDDEVIYTSTVIPVGNRIKEIVLDKDLDAGTYNAVCQYTLWNEDGTEDSSFGVNITLVINE